MHSSRMRTARSLTACRKVVGGMHGRGACVTGVCMAGGHVWPRGYAWQGRQACVAGGGGRHGSGVCVAGGHTWPGGVHGRGGGHVWQEGRGHA